jgi:type IV secretory pathway TrbD component
VTEMYVNEHDLLGGGERWVADLLAEANAARPVGARDLTVEDLRRWLPALVELVSTPEVDPGVRNVVRRLRAFLREE